MQLSSSNTTKPRRKLKNMTDIKKRLQDSISRNESTYLGFIALVLFMLGIWKQPFIGFETRFAVFAQEMLRNGPTLFPTTYGQPYPDYPVTSTLLIWLVSAPFGEVTKFTAVLPSAFASALVIALTYKLFAQYSRQWGLLAICFEFLTLAFIAEARSISLDQMISAITLAGFYLTNKSYREGTALPLGSLLLLLVAGFLVRGPIGVCLPAGVILTHLVLTFGRREILTFALSSAGVLIACSATLLGLAMLRYGKNFVNEIANMQAVTRFSESITTPFHYYFTSSFGNYALSYPIAMLVLLGTLFSKLRTTIQHHSKEHTTLIVLLLAWLAIVMIGLSIPETKKARYILPIVPALAGLASYAFISPAFQLMKWIRRCVEVILISLPLVAAILVNVQKTRLAESGINILAITGFLCTLFANNIFIAIFYKINEQKRALLLCVFGSLTTYFVQVVIVETIDLHIHDTSHFAARIESLMKERPGTLVFYQENPDGLPIKYLVNAKQEFLPLFMNSPEELKNNSVPIWALTRDENTEGLRKAGIDTESVIFHEKFSGNKFSVIYVSAQSLRPISPPRVTPEVSR
jgi:4-amino-4-deoxy-L-arabinose transferase-like glycosyltransferase